MCVYVYIYIYIYIHMRVGIYNYIHMSKDRLTMYLSLGACKESMVSLIQDSGGATRLYTY